MTPRCSHCSEPFDVEDNARPSPQGEAPPAEPPPHVGCGRLVDVALIQVACGTRALCRDCLVADQAPPAPVVSPPEPCARCSGPLTAVSVCLNRGCTNAPTTGAPTVSEALVERVAQAISRRAAGLISDVFAGQLARAAIAAMSPTPDDVTVERVARGLDRIVGCGMEEAGDVAFQLVKALPGIAAMSPGTHDSSKGAAVAIPCDRADGPGEVTTGVAPPSPAGSGAGDAEPPTFDVLTVVAASELARLTGKEWNYLTLAARTVLSTARGLGRLTPEPTPNAGQAMNRKPMSTEDDIVAEMQAAADALPMEGEYSRMRAAYQVVRRRVLEEAEDAAWKVADECNGAVSAIRVARRLHSMHTSQSAPAEPPAVTCNGTGFLPFVVSDEGRYTCPGCANPKCPSRQTTAEGRTK